MAQLFADAARAYLSAGIAAGDTTISISSGGALFPVANGTNWFKAVLQDASGIEIVYVTAHTSGSNSFTVTRGQEGTTARSFAAGSVFGIRVTAADMVGFAGKLSDAPSDGKTYGRKDGAWSEVVAGGAGAVVYLGTVTANGAASADITGLETLGATYSRMFLIADAVNLNGSSGTEIRAFFQMNGAWATANYEYSTETRIAGGAPTDAQSNTGTYIPICSAAAGGSANPGTFGTQILVNIHRTTGSGGRIDWKTIGLNSSLVFNSVSGVVQRANSTQGLQGIRFAPSTGTMFGVFRLYGIANS